MRRKLAAVLLAITLAVSLAACGDSSGPGGGDPSSAAKASGPDQSDGRKLADWAATKMINGETPALCKYGTADLNDDFAPYGWCETPISVKETPVSLDLIGMCDTRGRPHPTPQGDLYMYRIEPSQSIGLKGDKANTVEIIVEKHSADFLLESVYPYSADVNSDPLGTTRCPGTEATPTNGSIKLG